LHRGAVVVVELEQLQLAAGARLEVHRRLAQVQEPPARA
jgi:hypothetical protein